MSRGYSNSSSLPVFALVLILWSLHVKTQVSYTLCFAVAFCAQGAGRGGLGGQSQPMRASLKKREQEEEIQVLPENVSLQRRDNDEKPLGRSAGGSLTSKVSLRSDEVQREAPADPPPAATRQLNRVYLITSSVAMYAAPFFLFRSFHAFLRAKTQFRVKGFVSEVISWNSSTFSFVCFFSVCIEALVLVIKGFSRKQRVNEKSSG